MKTKTRVANFSSSKIWQLTTKGRAEGSLGAPFFTYVREKRREARVGRSIDNEAEANATAWGKLCEPIAHDILGLEYKDESKKRYFHLDLPWSGMPDERVGNEIVGDIKSPFTLTSYMNVYEAAENSKDIGQAIKEAKKEWYWQLVSNSILANLPVAELILFMPKRSMLDNIRAASEAAEYWFHRKTDEELPWTSGDSEFSPITKFRWNVEKSEADFLTDRVKLAAQLLNYKGELSLEDYAKTLNEEK